MAIIIEEEKKSSNLASTLGWLLILVILGFAGYYIFLASPPPVVLTPPASLQDISAITQINVDPQSVFGDPSFKKLQSSVAEPSPTGPTPVGKTNPFAP